VEGDIPLPCPGRESPKSFHFRSYFLQKLSGTFVIVLGGFKNRTVGYMFCMVVPNNNAKNILFS